MKRAKKILIAEDELLVARVLRMQFEKEGFEVENVVDADSAYLKAIEMQPDVILLDIRLKNNTSGIEAANKLRESGVNCLILFTTGNSYESTIKEIAHIANAKILIKPVDFKTILSYI